MGPGAMGDGFGDIADAGVPLHQQYIARADLDTEPLEVTQGQLRLAASFMRQPRAHPSHQPPFQTHRLNLLINQSLTITIAGVYLNQVSEKWRFSN